MVAICALAVMCVVGPAVHAGATAEEQDGDVVVLQMPSEAQQVQLIPDACVSEACKSCYAGCRIWCRFDPTCIPRCAKMWGCDSR
jgi:hypothetical protein